MPELHCSSNTAVYQYWQGPNNDYISENDKIEKKYEDKFELFGRYNLRILNFALTDAGMYKCQDSTDLGHPYSAEVIAIGK